MKKIVLLSAGILAFCFNGFSQFTNDSYKNIKLQISKAEFKKLTNADISKLKSNDNEFWPTSKMTITVDNVPLEITFLEAGDPILLSIASTSPNAKIKGFSANLIGNSLNEVKTILGSKLESYFDEENEYVYDMQDPQRTLILEFDDKKILRKIYCTLNQ